MHTRVMQKYTTLWNAASRPKSAEIIQSILRHALSRPGETRWNSLFDSLTQIQKIKEKSSEYTRALNLKQCTFTVSDHSYIEEFLFSVKPLSQALDILQGDKSVFYDSIEKRFSNILSCNTIEGENAAIAAFSHPKLKNKWLNCIPKSSSRDKLLSIFKKAVTAKSITRTSEENVEIEEDQNDFYDFGPATQNDRTDTSTSAEIEYFEDPRQHFESLNSHPAVKNIFLRYNSPVASSAPVERLFSFATMTNLLKSNRLSDNLFEYKVVLKSNLNYQLQNGN
ncbi:hypothetical protein QTP88_023069 [Uroleucon formosanum]